MFGLFIFRGILRSCNLSYACCLSDAVYVVDAKQIGDFFGGLGQETEECTGVRPSQCVMVCAISMTSSTSSGLFRYR